jgi:hypothetical protein
MALLLDVPGVSPEELAAHDGSLLETAAAEGIDLGKKVLLARDEIALELSAMLRQATPSIGGGDPVAGVVVTPALRLWLVFRSLELVYREVSNRQVNDRYQGKWKEHRELAKWAGRLLSEIGIGTVTNPIPQAAAVGATRVAGALASGVFYLRSAWTNAEGDEGAPGPETAVVVEGGDGILVTAGPPPAMAAGWNLYAGTDPLRLVLQNSSPIATTESYTVTTLVSGTREPGQGQAPQQYHHLRGVMQRG